MSDYRVYAKRSVKRLIKQKFYVVCVAANGEPEWRSEMYRDKDYAVQFAQRWTAICDGIFIDAT